ncbi:MAG: cellulase family glycosylhydrolase [Pirellulales bacterium]
MRWTCLIAWLMIQATTLQAADPQSSKDNTARTFVRLSEDRNGFVVGEPAEPFLPWGFNYDHDRQGRLLEDYWIEHWDDVVEDFREMRQLGANTVRIHLQLGRFLDSPQAVSATQIQQLRKLVRLAESEQLRLNLTGLGCYHKAAIPTWYDGLTEQQRWEVQGFFWKSIAMACRESPAIFCYDLMNEPVSPAGVRPGSDWLGPPLGDKHFVQYVALDPAGRTRAEIARRWIESLTAAIRSVDANHLVTVGMVDWSLERPGLTSGFPPDKVAAKLDFLCVHLYPKSGELAAALETLAGFAKVGKPVVIEETFPLACKPDEFRRFLAESRRDARGWIGFYWGETPAELRTRLEQLRKLAAGKEREAFREAVGASMTLESLEAFRELSPTREKTDRRASDEAR